MHRVWVSSWQFECCGDGFQVGSSVCLSVVEPDLEWLSEVLGEPDALQVTASEEHHDDSTTEISGHVLAIEGVSVDYAARDPNDRHLYPVRGSARRVSCDSLPAESAGGSGYTGYLVDLD